MTSCSRPLASFAEGIDLPGAYCRHVIICKLPFSVPDDPVEAATAEWLSAQQRNPFMEMSVPDAALRLKQACGRLLRSEKDYGRITYYKCCMILPAFCLCHWFTSHCSVIQYGVYLS